MIAAELQQRDEELAEAGHDPECAAFDDRECSCHVGGPAAPHVQTRPIRKVAKASVMDAAVVLEGDHARAYRRWTEAMRALGAAKAAFAAAGQEAQAAHEALATLSVGAAP